MAEQIDRLLRDQTEMGLYTPILDAMCKSLDVDEETLFFEVWYFFGRWDGAQHLWFIPPVLDCCLTLPSLDRDSALWWTLLCRILEPVTL